MNKKTQNSIIVIFFVSALVFFFMATMSKMPPILISILNESSDSDTKEISQKIENAYRENIYKRNYIIDIYGFSQNLLNKKIIGNMDFYKDNNGVMQVFNTDGEYTDFYNRMMELKNTADSRNIPIMYVQTPSRVIENYTETAEGFVNNENHNMDVLVDSLENSGIPVIDYRKYINESGEENTIAPQNVFFKTDLHMTTESEFNLLNIVTEKLEAEFGIKFQNKEQVLDINNYRINSYPFLGNYSRSAGKHFTDTDTFNIYHPEFDTDLRLMDENNTVLRQGDFESVVMNGYENQTNTDMYTYWVTDYVQFQSDCYKYENLAIKDGPNILVVMDSLGYRMVSYMTLMAKNITMVDPRYDTDGHNMLNILLNNDFDAIIVLQEISLNPTVLIKSHLKNPISEIISNSLPTSMMVGEKCDVDISVKNTGNETWKKHEQVKLCIWIDGKDYGYRIELPEGVEVKAGEKLTFTLYDFVMPKQDKVTIEFQMLQEGVQYFGEREGRVIYKR